MKRPVFRRTARSVNPIFRAKDPTLWKIGFCEGLIFRKLVVLLAPLLTVAFWNCYILPSALVFIKFVEGFCDKLATIESRRTVKRVKDERRKNIMYTFCDYLIKYSYYCFNHQKLEIICNSAGLEWVICRHVGHNTRVMACLDNYWWLHVAGHEFWQA